eukprot:65420-Rhodomonas_salina.3
MRNGRASTNATATGRSMSMARSLFLPSRPLESASAFSFAFCTEPLVSRMSIALTGCMLLDSDADPCACVCSQIAVVRHKVAHPTPILCSRARTFLKNMTTTSAAVSAAAATTPSAF